MTHNGLLGSLGGQAEYLRQLMIQQQLQQAGAQLAYQSYATPLQQFAHGAEEPDNHVLLLLESQPPHKGP